MANGILVVLEQIAPTVATALGGPLAGMAVAAVSKALDIEPEKVQDVIQAGKLTAEQVAGLKQAEMDLQKQAAELNLDFAKLAAGDRDSARKMQTSVHSWLPPVLALGVTWGFFGILVALMLGYTHQNAEIDIMLGSLGTAWTGVIAFYFGSSASSQSKDKLLYNSTPTIPHD
jgi:hypothetical protein